MNWKHKTAEEFWNRSAKTYDQRINPDDSSTASIMAHSREYLQYDSVVLDLGCATGYYALALAPYVKEVHGIDISEEMIQSAKKNAAIQNIPNVNFWKADVSNLLLNDKNYNSILAFNILHLVKDPKNTLSAICDLLLPGGLLLSATPCLETGISFQKLLIKTGSLLRIIPGIHTFKPKDVEALISNAQFDLVQTHIISDKIPVVFVAAKKKH